MYANILAMGATTTGTAAAGASGSGSLFSTLITFAVIIGIFYFLIIRPQKKKDKEAKEMLAAMKKGDKIVTIGGIRGTIAVVKDSTVVVKVDDNTRIEFSKNAISAILDKKQDRKVEKVEKPVEKLAEKPAETVEKPIAKAEKPAAKADKPSAKAPSHSGNSSDSSNSGKAKGAEKAEGPEAVPAAEPASEDDAAGDSASETSKEK